MSGEPHLVIKHPCCQRLVGHVLNVTGPAFTPFEGYMMCAWCGIAHRKEPMVPLENGGQFPASWLQKLPPLDSPELTSRVSA